MLYRYIEHIENNKTVVHLKGPGGNDYTLCGYALEGENGNLPLEISTIGQITCSQCLSIIEFCIAAKKQLKNNI